MGDKGAPSRSLDESLPERFYYFHLPGTQVLLPRGESQQEFIMSILFIHGWVSLMQIYTVRSEGGGWLDPVDPPLFSGDGKTCLLRIPWRDGKAGYFRHVVWLDVSSRKEIPISRGPFEVTQILAWDQANQFM